MTWQPIETAPTDGTEVLVYARGSYAVAFWSGKEWRDMGDIGWAGMYGDDGNQPTHWMPLPEPPNVEVTGAARLHRAVSGGPPGSAAGDSEKG